MDEILAKRDEIPEAPVHYVADPDDESLPAACGADSGRSPLRTRRLERTTCAQCLALMPESADGADVLHPQTSGDED